MVTSVIRNVHQRRFAADAATVGRLLSALGGPDDRLWPSSRWPAIVIPRPITVGDPAHHGSVRYVVDEYRPGEALWFRFDPSSGLVGRHGLLVEHCDDGTTALTHVIDGHATGTGRILWPLVIRAMHDQLLEELMDNAEVLLPGLARPVPEPARSHLDGPSTWGRALRSAFAAANRLRRIPPLAALGVAATGLVAAAAMHAMWATGTNWPGSDRVDLARKVVGGEVFPSDTATWIVVGMLTTATGFVAASLRRFRRPRVDQLVTFATSGVAGVLALRAIGGFVVSGGALIADRSGTFAPRDLLVYSPLCALLAAATAALAMQRTPDPMS